MRIFSANWGTGAGGGYPFDSLGKAFSVDNHDEFRKHEPTPEDILVIWGGADIHPSLYNRPNVASYVGHGPSVRDITEKELMEAAVELGVMTVGVCRGAQLACALAGGVLAQDVDHHGWTHDITLIKSGKQVSSSSVHHQMMVPLNVDHELIAVSSKTQSKHYEGLKPDEVEYIQKNGEPEIVWFPKKKFLAIQGHPEFMDEGCEFNQVVRQLIVEKL